MFDLILSDFRRYTCIESSHDASLLSKLNHSVFWYGLHAIAVYRLGHALKKLRPQILTPPLYGLYFLMKSFVTVAYGIDIDRRAQIGNGFYIGHFGGVYVGPACTIGDNCAINQHVTIGKGAQRETAPRTVVGNNVWIGGHSRINSGVSIADNVAVVVGSTITTDIGEGALVMGNPARIINNRYDNSSLIGTPKKT